MFPICIRAHLLAVLLALSSAWHLSILAAAVLPAGESLFLSSGADNVVVEYQSYITRVTSNTSIQFSLEATDGAVGGRLNFTSDTSVGPVLIYSSAIVSAPAGDPHAKLNPDFSFGTTVTISPGFATNFTYIADFGDLPIPSTFKMRMRATHFLDVGGLDRPSFSADDTNGSPKGLFE